MTAPASAIGDEVIVTGDGTDVKIRRYVVERPGYTAAMHASEFVLEVTLTLPHRIDVVWPATIDLDAWMNRFGYFWDARPADREDDWATLSNRTDLEALEGSAGASITYAIRKIVPGQLMYFDSPAQQVVGKDCYWSGHNLFIFEPAGDATRLTVFMEHTWFSDSMTAAEVRAEALTVLDAGVGFWKEYFIPDLFALVGRTAEAGVR